MMTKDHIETLQIENRKKTEPKELTFDEWLKTVCFRRPTREAYDLARAAWREAKRQG
jgi:hypothetical protein